MKKIKNYLRNFTLKSPCDNCIVLSNCKEINCSIEDKYFDAKEAIATCMYHLSFVWLCVILTIQLSGLYFYGSVPKNTGFVLSFFQFNLIFWQCRLMLLLRTRLIIFKRRQKDVLEKIDQMSRLVFPVYKNRTP